MSVVLEKRASGVAVVTIDRPQVMNALDVPAKERLGEIWQEIANDPQVRVIIHTGEGRAFQTGVDVTEIAAAVEAVLDRLETGSWDDSTNPEELNNLGRSVELTDGWQLMRR